MGCRIMEDRDTFQAVLYCSTTMWAFGPIFKSYEHAEDFIKWLGIDPRYLNELELSSKHSEWLKERCNDEGDLIEEPSDE